MTSFNLVTSFKTVSKYSHILRAWGLGRPFRNLGGHSSAHHSRSAQSQVLALGWKPGLQETQSVPPQAPPASPCPGCPFAQSSHPVALLGGLSRPPLGEFLFSENSAMCLLAGMRNISITW